MRRWAPAFTSVSTLINNRTALRTASFSEVPRAAAMALIAAFSFVVSRRTQQGTLLRCSVMVSI